MRRAKNDPGDRFPDARSPWAEAEAADLPDEARMPLDVLVSQFTDSRPSRRHRFKPDGAVHRGAIGSSPMEPSIAAPSVQARWTATRIDAITADLPSPWALGPMAFPWLDAAQADETARRLQI